jgi:hypothetical protein
MVSQEGVVEAGRQWNICHFVVGAMVATLVFTALAIWATFNLLGWFYLAGAENAG